MKTIHQMSRRNIHTHYAVYTNSARVERCIKLCGSRKTLFASANCACSASHMSGTLAIMPFHGAGWHRRGERSAGVGVDDDASGGEQDEV